MASRPPDSETQNSIHADGGGWSGLPPLRWMRARRGLPVGLLVLAVLIALTAIDPWPEQWLRRNWFDLYLKLSPRQPESSPAVIVAVDENSLRRFGQWPWPRNLVARLIDGIVAQDPAAVGLDILFSEPGRLSPDQWAATRSDLDPGVAARLRAMESNDQILARAMGRGPVVLGIGAEADGRDVAGRLTPFRVFGNPPLERLLSFGGLVRDLPILEERASGLGLLNGAVDGDGLVRGVPLVARVGNRLAPSLTLEMLRVATGETWYELHGGGRGISAVSVGRLDIPTGHDGRFRVLFGPHMAARYVSAAEVLDGTVAAERFNRKFVLVGVTGLGIVDHPPTPVAARMPGVEIHAQVLENIFDDTLLRRPEWAPRAEAGALATVGASVLVASLLRSALPLVLVMVAGSILLGGLGWYAYVTAHWLVDGATTTAYAWALFMVLFTANLSRADEERRRLRRELARERERALRTAGELAAAERIQMGILPTSGGLDADPRFELAVTLEPARVVGGDLYDFFKLGPRHLFFVVGDVAGKGVPASLFMAITKTLWKSTALRLGHGVNTIISEANREVARDNPEMMFVTAISGILDLDTGDLEFCIAGHDPPMVRGADGRVRRLAGVGGPPLCVVDDFQFPLEQTRLAPGDQLCVVTDGVTEAWSPTGELYGAARLEAALGGPREAGESAAALLGAVHRDVAAFCQGEPAADDLTIMVIGWRGPGS